MLKTFFPVTYTVWIGSVRAIFGEGVYTLQNENKNPKNLTRPGPPIHAEQRLEINAFIHWKNVTWRPILPLNTLFVQKLEVEEMDAPSSPHGLPTTKDATHYILKHRLYLPECYFKTDTAAECLVFAETRNKKQMR